MTCIILILIIIGVIEFIFKPRIYREQGNIILWVTINDERKYIILYEDHSGNLD